MLSDPMSPTLDLVLRHPYAVLCGAVFAEQLGLPLPAVPFLLGAGALVGRDKLSAALALLLPVAACLLADLVWYEAGRRRGGQVLKLLCRISLEPDSCVRRTENVFALRGERTLLFSKFLPGLNTLAPPMAGMIGMPLLRFLLWDVAGAILWAGSFLALGLAFSNQIEAVAEHAASGGRLVAVLLGLLALWLLWKYAQRQRFLRSLRVARITPEEVKQRMDAGEDLVVLDLRGSLEVARDPHRLPGALRFSAEDLEKRHQEIPRGREVVLYCT